MDKIEAFLWKPIDAKAFLEKKQVVKAYLLPQTNLVVFLNKKNEILGVFCK